MVMYSPMMDKPRAANTGQAPPRNPVRYRCEIYSREEACEEEGPGR